MENVFEELRDFLSDYWSYKKEKITMNKSLDDLGMFGDDKRDFLLSFNERFNIESKDLDLEKYCEPETFNPFRFLFFKKRSDDKIKIKINHLLDVMMKKKWFDPV